MPRSDLTSAFLAAMQNNGRSPRQLAVFHFPIAGDDYLSDQSLGAADGLSHEYRAIIEDWGTLTDMAGGNPRDHKAGEIRQLTLTIWNGGANPFSDKFLSENPENVLVDVYQWETSLAESDAALIDTFVIQDPIQYNENNYLLSLDLVSVSMRYDNPVGDVLTIADWPNAKPDHLGQGINIIVGTPGEVKTLAAKVPAITTLDGSILSDTLSMSANDDLDEAGFPSFGILQIDKEFLRFDSRTTTTFNIVQRGYLSDATEHISQKQIIELITDYTYLIGKGPINSVDNIKIGGFPNEAAVTVDTSSDPARLIFSEVPYSKRFADTITFLNMRFDAINADNTATQPHLAFDPETAGTAAITSADNSKLSVRQTTINPNQGEIVKVFLVIEHYESSKNLLSDLATVIVSGLGQIGVLSRPAQTEIVDIVAEIDIDHSHDHNISNEHTHPFSDPLISTNDPAHGHDFTGASSAVFYPDGSIPRSGYGTLVFTISGLPPIQDSFVVRINASVAGYAPYMRVGFEVLSGTSGNYTIQLGAGTGTTRSFSITGYSYVGGTPPFDYDASGFVTVYSLEIDVISGSDVIANQSGVVSNITTPGSNATTGSNKIDDVMPLATDNISLQVAQADQATRTVANTFDLTNDVNFDWEWFTNRDVAIEYTGTTDAQKIYILNMFFDVEYRKIETVLSDDITCEPTGIIDDGSGTYTGIPGFLIKRPDHLRRYILQNGGSLPGGYINTSSFDDAGTRYDAINYEFNGVIDANATVRELEKKMAYQCRSRFFWNAGQAQIKLKEFLADLTIDAALVADDFRLKSFNAERQPVADLNNKISIGYNKDWLKSDDNLAAFKLFSSGADSESIANNGTRENREGFLFDLVATQAMADDLKDFYLENLANASTFYEFETYLDHFDLEKEDGITLTTNFGSLKKARAIIRAADRIFGSGKLNRINTLRMVAEVVRYILLQKTLSETVTVFDNIAFLFAFNNLMDLSDVISTSDSVSIEEGRAIADGVTFADTFSILMDWAASIGESVVLTDLLSFDFAVIIGDSIVIQDISTQVIIGGYGTDRYGYKWGGKPTILDVQGDSIGISDEVTVVLNP